MSSKLLKKLHLWGLYRKITLYRVNVLLAGTKTKNFEKKRKLLNRLDNFDLGEGTRVVGPVEVYGKLKTGKNCWIAKNLRINGNGTVTMEDNSGVGPEVTFQTGGHEIGDATCRYGADVTFNQTVGSGTWVGMRCTIVNNVTIGAGCVIAACACVTKDIQPNTLVGGVPAKLIREL